MRLFDIQPTAQRVPADLTVAVGDVIRFAASGGRVREGNSVELIGIFVPGVLGTDGRLLSPKASPNTVLFRAVAPGRTAIDIVTGNPLGATETVQTTLTVE